MYEGFAAGVNRYVELHPHEFPAGFAPHFTGYDVAARDVNSASLAQRAPLPRADGSRDPPRGHRPTAADPSNEGARHDRASTPSRRARTRGRSRRAARSPGRAILLRNPHLAWNAGYYEAHMTVPGVLDFYGDFRIGGPFGVIGGFNKDLGWSTTNNAPDLDEIYALDVDPARADHYLFDGASLPLERELVDGRRTGTATGSRPRRASRGARRSAP